MEPYDAVTEATPKQTSPRFTVRIDDYSDPKNLRSAALSVAFKFSKAVFDLIFRIGQKSDRQLSKLQNPKSLDLSRQPTIIREKCFAVFDQCDSKLNRIRSLEALMLGTQSRCLLCDPDIEIDHIEMGISKENLSVGFDQFLVSMPKRMGHDFCQGQGRGHKLQVRRLRS